MKRSNVYSLSTCYAYGIWREPLVEQNHNFLEWSPLARSYKKSLRHIFLGDYTLVPFARISSFQQYMPWLQVVTQPGLQHLVRAYLWHSATLDSLPLTGSSHYFSADVPSIYCCCMTLCRGIPSKYNCLVVGKRGFWTIGGVSRSFELPLYTGYELGRNVIMTERMAADVSRK